MDESKPHTRLDAVGKFWVIFCSIWTTAVAAGLGFLWIQRDAPLLRLRGLSLVTSAMICLHLYLIAVQMVYVVSPFPEQAEYWIMGIWLPFGIALFHASNTRFLYIAQQQRRFARGSVESGGPVTSYKRFDRTTRVLFLIGIGMAVQLILTIIMWLLSRKFHPSFGILGTGVEGSPWEVNAKQGTGWEWWPSVVWQFYWSWIVAPVVLWRARRIHDTLGWRTQTLACCLAGLPATPMWLLALYVPAMKPVNKYWVPPQWIGVSIMLFEVFSIFLPCWQVLRYQALRQDTLNTIAAWESEKQLNGEGSSESFAVTSTAGTLKPAQKSSWKLSSSVHTSYSGDSLLSMGALEHVLDRNPDPLREFSALRDFSGENVAFLTAVAEWKNRFPREEGPSREVYTEALRIYLDFISLQDAEFPINISFQDRTQLEGVFEEAARALRGNSGLSNQVTPFEVPGISPQAETRQSLNSQRAILDPKPHESHELSTVELGPATIPAGFDVTIFDKAEISIKYLVLTNTWPKFVEERWRLGGSLTLTSCASEVPRTSLAGRISRILACEA